MNQSYKNPYWRVMDFQLVYLDIKWYAAYFFERLDDADFEETPTPIIKTTISLKTIEERHFNVICTHQMSLQYAQCILFQIIAVMCVVWQPHIVLEWKMIVKFIFYLHRMCYWALVNNVHGKFHGVIGKHWREAFISVFGNRMDEMNFSALWPPKMQLI